MLVDLRRRGDGDHPGVGGVVLVAPPSEEVTSGDPDGEQAGRDGEQPGPFDGPGDQMGGPRRPARWRKYR